MFLICVKMFPDVTAASWELEGIRTDCPEEFIDQTKELLTRNKS